DEGITLVVAAAPFVPFDHSARNRGLQSGPAPILGQRAVRDGTEALQGRSISVERVAGKIEAHGAELFAQAFVRWPIEGLDQANGLARASVVAEQGRLAGLALART